MNQEFKRPALLPILFLLPAILFGFTFFLQLATGNPVAMLTLIASVLFFINSIWSFSTPIISIVDGKTIHFKEALLRQKEISISNIQSIHLSNEKLIELLQKDNSKITIRMNTIKEEDRYDFMKLIKQIISDNNIDIK